jgi:hypothetical protein
VVTLGACHSIGSATLQMLNKGFVGSRAVCELIACLPRIFLRPRSRAQSYGPVGSPYKRMHAERSAFPMGKQFCLPEGLIGYTIAQAARAERRTTSIS